MGRKPLVGLLSLCLLSLGINGCRWINNCDSCKEDPCKTGNCATTAQQNNQVSSQRISGQQILESPGSGRVALNNYPGFQSRSTPPVPGMGTVPPGYAPITRTNPAFAGATQIGQPQVARLRTDQTLGAPVPPTVPTRSNVSLLQNSSTVSGGSIPHQRISPSAMVSNQPYTVPPPSMPTIQRHPQPVVQRIAPPPSIEMKKPNAPPPPLDQSSIRPLASSVPPVQPQNRPPTQTTVGEEAIPTVIPMEVKPATTQHSQPIPKRFPLPPTPANLRYPGMDSGPGTLPTLPGSTGARPALPGPSQVPTVQNRVSGKPPSVNTLMPSPAGQPEASSAGTTNLPLPPPPPPIY